MCLIAACVRAIVSPSLMFFPSLSREYANLSDSDDFFSFSAWSALHLGALAARRGAVMDACVRACVCV